MRAAPLVLVSATSDIATSGESASPRVWLSRAYTDALIANGLTPVILPPMSGASSIAALDGVAGLVLTGGEDIDPQHFGEELHPATGALHTERDSCEIALVRAAAERRIPTLAICRGAQIANVALGGTVIQDISPLHPRGKERIHAVELESDSRLAFIVGATTVQVNGFHHQAIGRIAPSVRVVGRSPDGIVEAIEASDSDWWMVGVQWHAEDLTATAEDWDRRLFSAFAGEVRGR